MARLVLHIGGHKTGTTYIQSVFHKNRRLMKQHGVVYPAIGTPKAHHVLSATWITAKATQGIASKVGGADVAWDRFLTKSKNQKGTIFLSSENFSRAHPQKVDMSELADRLSVFEDVKIIFTAREQAGLAQSAWLQVAKSKKVLSLDEAFSSILETGRWRGLWYDYNLLYDHVLSGFKPSQIHLMIR